MKETEVSIHVHNHMSRSQILPRNVGSYKVLPPPFDMREAAAAAAVGTTPVETPGFDR